MPPAVSQPLAIIYAAGMETPNFSRSVLGWEAYAARSPVPVFMFHLMPSRVHTFPCLRRSRFATGGRMEGPHFVITCVVAYEAAIAITGYASA